jgi:hypothetical protein
MVAILLLGFVSGLPYALADDAVIYGTLECEKF